MLSTYVARTGAASTRCAERRFPLHPRCNRPFAERFCALTERKGSGPRTAAPPCLPEKPRGGLLLKEVNLINNRQGGRRRGRGGQRPQNVGGRPDGNRQDNRQRGNAAQLLEKYKSMARDAQLAGDRVQTEYYLQFADHYYRVLGESRARYEEQRRQRGDDGDDDDVDDEMSDGEAEVQLADGGEDDRSERRPRDRGDRQDRQDRQERGSGRDRGRRFGREERAYGDGEAGGDSDTRNGSARANGGGEGIAFDVLPPAIGRDPDIAADGGDEGEDAAPRPRRRRLRPRAEGEGEVAPAA